MANLRANNICGTDGRTAITGSVEFDGTGDYLSLPSSSDFDLGTGNFTVECFVYLGDITSNSGYVGIVNRHNYNNNTGWGLWKESGGKFGFWCNALLTQINGTTNVATNSWYHISTVRSGSTISLYVNGVLEGSATNSSFNDASTPFGIGAADSGLGNTWNSHYSVKGFISNLRVIKGTALYTQNFIPPTSKLKNLPGTVLLCCTDNNSVTTEATGKTITANGNPTATKQTPQVGTDSGVVFDGATRIKTQNYFYLPTGPTEQRFPNFAGVDAASARGVFAGGYGATNIIDYITISSTGNAADFGDLVGATANPGAVASPIRGVFAGGYIAPVVANTIQYITISTTGNAQDFGDLTSTRNNAAGCSSSTRGIFAGGAPNINTIEYVTIFSSGNSIDFGDLIVVRSNAGGCSSPTRGIFAGGDTAPAGFTNSIDYVTIATTANAIDFGDLSAPKDPASCSNSVRGLFAGGRAPTAINVIEYITIASTGNVTDFGDLSGVRRFLEGASSSTRGVFGGGYTTSPVSTSVNIIEYVTILTTGNAVDFGDLTLSRFSLSALSNGHGGLG